MKTAEEIREELIAKYPNITEQQILNIIAVRTKPRNYKAELKAVDMGDPDLSINYKKYLMGEEND